MGKFFESIPKFFLGPLIVIVAIFYFTQQDPPKTICDTQFEIFKEANKKYIFGYKAKQIVVPPGSKRDIELCQSTNSPGGCYDWLEGLRKILPSSRHIPAGCENRIDELAPYRPFLEQSLFVFSQISWNNTPILRIGLYNWLEHDELILFCKVKREYIRLAGPVKYKALEQNLLKQLITLRKLSPKQTWERTVLSYKCPILN